MNGDPQEIQGPGNFWAIDITNAVQIAFWVLVGILSLLTYLQARRTFFQPLRLEAFKLQLARIEHLNGTYGSGSEGLDSHFDVHNLVRLNAVLAAIDHLKGLGVSERQLPSEWLDLRSEDAGGVLLLPSDAVVTLRVGPLDSADQSGDPAAIEDGAMKMVRVTRRYADAARELRLHLSDPLIPQGLRQILVDLDKTLHANLECVWATVEDVKTSFANGHRETGGVIRIDLTWVSNAYNHVSGATSLEQYSIEIAEFVSSYFEPDSLGFSRITRRRRLT